MHTNVPAALRLSRTIGVIKWVLIGITILTGLVLAINRSMDASAQQAVYGTGMGEGSTFFLYALVALASAAWTWMVLGFLQHVLGMLAETARNTTPQPQAAI